MNVEIGFAPGKRRLIEAALRLATGGRSITSIGIRELAREAQLNPNTFYRHFATLEELAGEAVEWTSRLLRPMLRRKRWEAAREGPLSVPRLAAAGFFAFTLEHPDAFLSGLAEYHGTSPGLRRAVRAVLAEVAAEMADDVVQLDLTPGLPRASIDEICLQIVLQLFERSRDYIEEAEQREPILDEAERFVMRLFVGEMAMRRFDPT